jgi:hypothetical protein
LDFKKETSVAPMECSLNLKTPEFKLKGWRNIWNSYFAGGNEKNVTTPLKTVQ